MKLLASDLADNSNEPKILKLQDIDTWTKSELISFIINYSNRRNYLNENTKP